MSVPLILASASPARLATLRRAGVHPTVMVSHLDEAAVLAKAEKAATLPRTEIPLVLAHAKCLAIAERADTSGHLVVGCDSLLELDGELQGKPRDPQEAIHRWHRMSGRTAILHTGHWLIDRRHPEPIDGIGAVASTIVHFAEVSDDEVRDYVATGEPLQVAGAFTIDGLGGPFVENIEGDPHNVVGISLPVLRRLLKHVDLRWSDISNPTK